MNSFIKTAAAAALIVGLGACASTEPVETAEAPAPAPSPAPEPAPEPREEVVTRPAEPSGPAAGSVADFRVNVGERVYFDFDESSLDGDDREILKRQAAWLQSYPSTRIMVAGNCDERGTREYNLALGERRASRVKDYLVGLGVDSARIDTISYGKERPIADGSNDQAWALNRNGWTQITSGARG